MPSVILIDVSISMGRDLSIANKTKDIHTFIDLAKNISNELVTTIGKCSDELEHVSLARFSSKCEILSNYSRDYDFICKLCTSSTKLYDSSCLYTALNFIINESLDYWQSNVPIHIFVVSDGIFSDILEYDQLPLLNNFIKINFINIDSDNEDSDNIFKDRMVNISNFESIPVPNINSITAITKLIEECFCRHSIKIQCGNLNSHTYQLYPCFNDLLINCHIIMEIIGFIELNELNTSSFYSKHLLLPKFCKDEDIHSPSFLVLLHGSLKVGKMCALVKMNNNDCYGALQSVADSRKKSNLILFYFGTNKFLTTLGKINHLNHEMLLDETNSNQTSLSCESSTKTSYNSNQQYFSCTSSIPNIISRISRYCQKLPEKKEALIKEIEVAIDNSKIYGWVEIIDEIRSIIESKIVQNYKNVKIFDILCEVKQLVD